MGNKNSDLTDTQFRQQWQSFIQLNGRTLWQNKQNQSLKLEQYIVAKDEAENNPKLKELRKKSSFVVNAHSIKNQGFSCQMDNNNQRLFVQHIVLRLSALKGIPYPDILHLYDVVINGYGELTKVIGYFSVDEDQVGINSLGQAKVWLSNRFESNKINGVKVTETKMVNDLLNLLQSKTNSATNGKYPNIAQYIKGHEKINLQEVSSKFVEYVRKYAEGEVQTRLAYLNLATLSQNQNVVGSVESVNRQPAQIKKEIVNVVTVEKVQNSIQQAPTSITSSQQVLTTSMNPVYINNVAPIRISQPYPVAVQPFQQEIVTRPLKPQTVVNSSMIGTPTITFGGRPTTSLKLARNPSQNVGFQNVGQFNQAPIQQVPVQVYQRPLPVQSTIHANRNVELNNTPVVISQSTIPSYNQPIQVVESFAVNQPRPVPLEVSNISKILENIQGSPVVENKGEFVTTSYPSGTTNLATFSKVAESEVKNVAAVTSNQNATVKASKTVAWQDYTNKNDTSKGLTNNYGLSTPQNFDVGISKKIEPQYVSGAPKFTTENDGKSSPEFLALLSQIKSGIGQTSGLSQTYSYSGSKNEGNVGSYQTSKFSSNYVSSSYTGGLDPELHADLQKYRQ